MSIQRREFVAVLGTSGAVGLAGCAALGSDGGGDPSIDSESLTLVTTTSTHDTGLLDELNLAFRDRYGVTVDTIAEGTGAALEHARNGDTDVVVVHARSLEDELLEDGYGINRRALMFNDFVLVGEPADPASVERVDAATDAVRAIADSETRFVSRGDNSGTHAKERELWKEAGLTVDSLGEWYIDGGAGMGEILVQTDQQGAYTLADRGTYLSMRDDLDLEIHLEGPVGDGPERLANPYGIVAVDPAVHENVNYDLAMAYIGYVTGAEGQAIVEEYTVDGEQLFFPEALTDDPNFQQYVPEGWDATAND